MFHGSIVALVTPMTPQGQIDFQALDVLLQFHLDNQTDGLVICGSTGEAATLTDEEVLQILDFAVKKIKGRIPIIAGTGTNCTTKTIHKTKKAMETGVDACLIVTPYYNKPTQEGLYQHYQAIAQACPLPLILYNIPGRSVVDLLPETVLRLAEIPNIVAIKESSSELLKRTEFYVQHLSLNHRLDVLSGDDAPTLEAMKLGAKGVISVTGNVAPKLLHQMCTFALQKDWDQANHIHQQLMPLHDKLFIETNPIPVKWALARMNLIQNSLRLPLTPLGKNNEHIVEAALKVTGVI